jgi:hypothetical protein
MGANSTQAIGLTLFLIAFALIAASLALGGNLLLLLPGVAVLAASTWVFLKARPWEQQEE